MDAAYRRNTKFKILAKLQRLLCLFLIGSFPPPLHLA